MQVTCPNCTTTYNAPDHFAGKVIVCQRCKREVTIPHSPLSDSLPEDTQKGNSYEEAASLIFSPPQTAQAPPKEDRPFDPLFPNAPHPKKTSEIQLFGYASSILGLLGVAVFTTGSRYEICIYIGALFTLLGLAAACVGLHLSLHRKRPGILSSLCGAAVCTLLIYFEGMSAYNFYARLNKDPTAKTEAMIAEARATNQQVITPNLELERKENRVYDDEWAYATNSVQQNDFRVTVKSVKVDYVAAKNRRGNFKSTQRQLQIRLILSNTGKTKKIDYQGWKGSRTSLESETVIVRDNFGTNYLRVVYDFDSAEVIGQIQSESIDPGKSISDVLVFEKPTRSIEYLLLELPAKNFGGTGRFRIRIPNSMINYK